MRTVSIVEYDSGWPVLFANECALLRKAVGSVAKAIHHIGSTAVPGLAAKPVIDILMEVSSLEALDALSEKMTGIGYTPRGELGISGRRYFSRGGEDRTHHLHAFVVNDSNLARHLAFRDYLRANPTVAKEYGELKKNVAESCGNDLGRYCDGKDAYVKRMEAIAVREAAPKRA